MKKSKEQITNELGKLYVDHPEFWSHLFGFYDYKGNKRIYNLSRYSNIKTLEEQIEAWVDIKFYGWRKVQTDWRSINDLVIYDRFGSRMTWTEEPERSIEIKLTDAGQKNWELDTELFSLSAPEWGGTRAIEISRQIHEMNRLFPAKEYI